MILQTLMGLALIVFASITPWAWSRAAEALSIAFRACARETRSRSRRSESIGTSSMSMPWILQLRRNVKLVY